MAFCRRLLFPTTVLRPVPSRSTLLMVSLFANRRYGVGVTAGVTDVPMIVVGVAFIESTREELVTAGVGVACGRFLVCKEVEEVFVGIELAMIEIEESILGGNICCINDMVFVGLIDFVSALVLVGWIDFVSDTNDMVFVGSINFVSDTNALVLVGWIAFVSDTNDMVFVGSIDFVSDTNALVLVGWIDFVSDTNALVLVGWIDWAFRVDVSFEGVEC